VIKMAGRGRPKKDDAYTRLLNYYNQKTQRPEPELVECECGKIIDATKLTTHQTTQMHKRLLDLKRRYEEPRPEED
jgi:hypothetical protein